MAASVSAPPAGWRQAIVDRVALIVASLTGPFGVLMAPAMDHPMARTRRRIRSRPGSSLRSKSWTETPTGAQRATQSPVHGPRPHARATSEADARSLPSAGSTDHRGPTSALRAAATGQLGAAPAAARRWADAACAKWGQLPAGLQWLVTVAAAYAVLVLRRPETLLRPQFLNEDGPVFFLGAFFGSPLESLLRSYNGYLHLVPRLVALLERLVPVVWAPFVSNATALAVTACVAVFVASDRMAQVMPDRRLRYAVAAFLLVLPASHETLGSITYVEFYLGIYLVAASMAALPKGHWQTVRDGASLVAAGLTGPFGVLFAPLYWARAWADRDRASALRAALVSVSAAIQVVTFARWAVTPGHPMPLDLHPTALAVAQVVGFRFVDVPVLGAVWSVLATRAGVPFVAGVAGSLLLALMLWSESLALPSVVRLQLGYAWAAAGAAALLREGPSIPGLLNPGLDERYSLIPVAAVGVTVVAGLVVARGRGRLVAAVLAALLVCGVVADFRLPPWPAVDWAHASACIGGSEPCVIPEYQNWTIRWPGRGGAYVQPWP